MPEQNPLPLHGKVALVTGASRGIGAAAALRLAESGVAVLVNFHRNRQAAEAVVRRIEAAGGCALAWQADVARQDEVEQMVRAAERELGPVDVLVNNAYFPLQVGPPRRR
jgi:3-oxoacyl-[acyl-carrier protein] reductase